MDARTALAVTDVGAGPPVLLVHGQPGSRADWLRLVPLLSDDHRVLSVDRPGYGASDAEAVGMLENAELLGELLVELSALGATVVGHSLGAGIALAMAERSLGAGALVLVGAAGVDGTVGMLDHVLALPLFGAIGVTGVRRVTRALGARATGPVGLAIAGWGPDSGHSFTFEQRALLRERTLLEAGLDAITVPATVVVGSRDLVVSPKAQRALADRISGARLVELHGAGHLIPHHEPERLATIVRAATHRAAQAASGTGPESFSTS
jgi:pimeloyl-ACP methyl ester carboxylesterase